MNDILFNDTIEMFRNLQEVDAIVPGDSRALGNHEGVYKSYGRK